MRRELTVLFFKSKSCLFEISCIDKLSLKDSVMARATREEETQEHVV
jgi:hypothetical protein